jgi:hypothetical protein
MGYKMRTTNMSLTMWVRWNGSALLPAWDEVIGTELYSHEGDTG